MKSLNTYILEWQLSNSNKPKLITPKWNSDLKDLIVKRLRDNIKKPYLLDIDTSNITDMTGLFSGWDADYLREHGIEGGEIEYIDISTWNTSKVKKMDRMFYDCYNLKSVKLNFDTSNVESMNGMFNTCTAIEELDLPFDTHNVKETNYMFSGCRSLKIIHHIDEWDISNFDSVKKIGDPTINWTVKEINNQCGMFNGCEKLKLPNWRKTK